MLSSYHDSFENPCSARVFSRTDKPVLEKPNQKQSEPQADPQAL